MIGLNLYKVGKERCTTCTCRTVPDAHVALHEMHMSRCTRCTCRTLLLTEEKSTSLRQKPSTFLIFNHKHIAPDVQHLFIRGYTILI